MKFKHKGFTLVQEEEVNHYYSIFDEDGKFVCYLAYDGELFSRVEAKKRIENYLKLIKMLDENGERLMNDD